MTIYSLDIFLSQSWTSPLFHVQFYLFLLDLYLGFSGKVVWYFQPLMNFPQFVVIHTVKGFSVVSEAEVDVFLEFSCFSYDPAYVGNLISGSSSFSKSILYIWKFLVHMLLTPSLKDFKHYFASMWNEHSCTVVRTFFGIFFLWDWKTDLFQSCGHCWVFQICWHIDCSTLTASSFFIWNSSAGISSPPLALFMVILPKAHLTSRSRMSGSRWVTLVFSGTLAVGEAQKSC